MTDSDIYGKALLKHHLITQHIENVLKHHKNHPHRQLFDKLKAHADNELIQLNKAHGGGFMDWLKSLFSSKREPVGLTGYNSNTSHIQEQNKLHNKLADMGFYSHRRLPY